MLFKVFCEDACTSFGYDWTSDGYCDDGGEGAQYSMCDLGSDCTGARRP